MCIYEATNIYIYIYVYIYIYMYIYIYAYVYEATISTLKMQRPIFIAQFMATTTMLLLAATMVANLKSRRHCANVLGSMTLTAG